MKQKLIDLKGEIGKFTIIVGLFNTPLSTTEMTITQKTSKVREELNNTINQWYPTDI